MAAQEIDKQEAKKKKRKEKKEIHRLEKPINTKQGCRSKSWKD